MPPRDGIFRPNGDVRISFGDGNYIETPVSSIEIDLPEEFGESNEYIRRLRTEGQFTASIDADELNTFLDVFNALGCTSFNRESLGDDFPKEPDLNEPFVSFEETMGFNT